MHKIKELLKNNNSLSIFSLILTVVMAMVSWAFLLRFLSKEEFGQMVFFITGASMIDTIKYGAIGASLIHKLAGTSDVSLKKEYIGSGWFWGLLFTVIIFCVSKSLMFFLNNDIINSKLYFLVKWYPFYSLATLPVFYARSCLEAENRFDKTFKISLFLSLTIPILSPLAVIFADFTVEQLIILTIVIHGTVSFFFISIGWTGLKNILYVTKKSVLELISYGQYTLGTSIASNLLQSSDVIIITLLLTNADLAVYSIPLKAIDLFHALISSFTAVAFPLISEAYSQKKMGRVRKIFYRYTGSLTLLLIPCFILSIAISPLIILVLGGKSYAYDVRTVQILRIFLFYGFFLTIDRFTGALLDGINRPRLNSIKVYIMLTLNILGDIAVINLFDSIVYVAMVTVLNGFLGIFLGFKFLNMHIDISFFQLFKVGKTTLSYYSKKYFHRKESLNETQSP